MEAIGVRPIKGFDNYTIASDGTITNLKGRELKTQLQLAREYGVSGPLINKIKSGKVYKPDALRHINKEKK